MQDSPQTQAAALTDAALRLLASGRSAASLGAAELAASAGLPEPAFQRCFPAREDFLTAVFQRLLDEAREEATRATADLPAGMLRLKRGVEGYLDSHLRSPALRELTLALRGHDPAQAIIVQRIAGFHRVLQVGLSALRSLHPLAAAQLATALVVETTQAEYEAQSPLPDLRETLYAYLDHLAP